MTDQEKLTASNILKKHEDEHEYHLHQSDREWIMEAMDEYAKDYNTQHVLRCKCCGTEIKK